MLQQLKKDKLAISKGVTVTIILIVLIIVLFFIAISSQANTFRNALGL